MLRWHRHHGVGSATPTPRDPVAADAEQLVDESEAFLAGHLLDVLRRAGQPVPAWVWLNQVAHGEPGDVIALALDAQAGAVEGSWPAAQAVISLEVLRHSEGSLERLVELQREVVVPLEVDLAGGAVTRLTPARLVRLVRAELAYDAGDDADIA